MSDDQKHDAMVAAIARVGRICKPHVLDKLADKEVDPFDSLTEEEWGVLTAAYGAALQDEGAEFDPDAFESYRYDIRARVVQLRDQGELDDCLVDVLADELDDHLEDLLGEEAEA